jgi:hypothetical protein
MEGLMLNGNEIRTIQTTLKRIEKKLDKLAIKKPKPLTRAQKLAQARKTHKTSCFDCRKEKSCFKNPKDEDWACFNPL